MKFSEAIYEGAKKFGNHHNFASRDGTCGCAVGSALLLVRGKDWVDAYYASPVYGEESWKWDWVYEAFPIAKMKVSKLPDSRMGLWYYTKTLGEICSSLHLNYKWTREAIAMWVESIEKEIEAKNAKPEEKTAEISTPVVDGHPVLNG